MGTSTTRPVSPRAKRACIAIRRATGHGICKAACVGSKFRQFAKRQQVIVQPQGNQPGPVCSGKDHFGLGAAIGHPAGDECLSDTMVGQARLRGDLA